MGTKVTLTAADGFRLNAYRADPAGPVRGGVVVIQEIFGVNHHIRSICDRLADAGYRAMAPQVFDRVEANFESGYTVPEVTYAREVAGRVDWAKMMLDASAAIDALKHEGPVAILGFCMGGSVAFLAATRFSGLAASICYYGGQIVRNADLRPKCPVQMHFGEEDSHISMSDVETIRQKRPECEIHIYPGAGHAFGNDERSNYELRSAKIAWQRTLALLARVFASAKSRQQAAEAPAPLRTAIPVAVADAGRKKPEIKTPIVEKRETKSLQAKEPAVEPPKPKKTAVKKRPSQRQKIERLKAEKRKVRKIRVKKSRIEEPKPQPKSKRAEIRAKRIKMQPAIRTRRKSRARPKIKARPKVKILRKRNVRRSIAARPKSGLRPKHKPKPKPRLRTGLRPAPTPTPRPKRPFAKRPMATKKLHEKPKLKAKPKPRRRRRKTEPRPKKMWGFALFSSPNYRRGRF